MFSGILRDQKYAEFVCAKSQRNFRSAKFDYTIENTTFRCSIFMRGKCVGGGQCDVEGWLRKEARQLSFLGGKCSATVVWLLCSFLTTFV